MRLLHRAAAVLALLAAAVLPTAAPAAADVVDPATAPPVRVITYNVCGASTCQSTLDLPAWTAKVKEQTLAWDADALMLQELCFTQWTSVRTALAEAGYTAVWGFAKKTPGCEHWGGTDTGFGLGIFVKASAVDRYTANLTTPGTEPRPVLCARGPIDGRTTLVCNAHLDQKITPDNGSAEALRYVDGWAAGLPVILGGDFNAGTEPVYDPMLDPVRQGLPGTGPFAEADENDHDWYARAGCDAAATECHSGEPTVASGKKFDHVFLSARDFHTVRADALEPEMPAGAKPLSDHQLLVAAAYPEPRPGTSVGGDLTGDGRADFLAVKDDGSLRLYSGTGGGALAGMRQIGTGGWTGAAVSHRGDWTGDGREDVLARIGDELWVYPNKGSGELGARIAMGGRPTGWSNAGATPLAAGDVDGDGLPDVLARSTTGLWLHRGGPAVDGRPTFAAKAALQIGDAEWAGYDVILPGDVTGDGKADVWGRDRVTGQIRQYASQGAQHLATPRDLTGGPWTAADRRLAVSAGDVTGDGLTDLWTTRTAGTAEDLEFLPGTASGIAGGLGTPTTIGTGGWQWLTALG
ncbi:FG-GAP-like repeat-containing protein [Streptomyces sp. NPDC053431]|uniref:FG-GAP-like repeat-containing protein n=1 Tax=Streptomyces sp. NPDC053431 TaxID=3365703 RepID=UPI0037D828CB